MSRAAIVLAAFLFVLSPVPAAAQIEAYLGRPVAEVRLRVQGQPTAEAELQNAVETQAGGQLTAARVRESIIHLMALGRFDDVEVDATDTPKGVVLTYDLRPLRTVRSIDFRGRLGLASGRLHAEVVDRYGTTPPLSRASDMRESLLEFYRDHGYTHATVEPHPETSPRGGDTTLIFEVDAGLQARITSINWPEGDIDRGELRRRLRLTALPAPYDPAEIAQRVSDYTEALRGEGFYQASIAVSPRFSADETTVVLDISATRGPRVTVALAGDPVPSARLDDLVPIKRENAVDQDLIEDWTANIEIYLRAQGYKEAKAPNERRTVGGVLHIVFNVQRGPRYIIDGVDLAGNTALSASVIDQILAPLKIARGEPFGERIVDAGAQNIKLRYRAAGFASADAKPEYTYRKTENEVRVGIVIRVQEGPQTRTASVSFSGNERFTSTALQEAVKTKAGEAFVPETVEDDRGTILTMYLNRGQVLATVTAASAVSTDRSRADVRFVIDEGPLVRVDHVLVIGNEHTKASTIRTALGLSPGDPLALDKLAAGQQRVVALGLFRRVQVSQLQHGTETERDVLVTVQEAPATTIAYGAGLEGAKRQRQDANGNAVEKIDLAPRGLFEIGRRNLWGKNRSVNFNGSFAVRPESTGIVGTGLREYRALGTYREPRIFGVGADLMVTGGVEQAVRPAYSFNRRGVRAEVARPLSPTMTFIGRYGLDRTNVINEPASFEDQIRLGRILPQVRLSKFSSSVVRDTRDDSVDPARGVLASWDGEIAPVAIGSQIGVAKTVLQAFVYRQLPAKRRVVFAGGVRLGFATGWGTTTAVDEQGNPITVPVTNPPLSERFFAGGNTTVRGVAEDTLGTPTTLINGFATGGGSLVILNGELRYSLWRSLAAVTFLDAGNVYELASKFEPTNLQPAVGVGLRYKSPIGPIRVDIGFNLNRRVLGTQRESLTVVSFGIGQAF